MKEAMMYLAASARFANGFRSGVTLALPLALLAVVAIAPTNALAANTCNAFLSIDYPSGPNFALPGDIYRVALEIGTGSINGGTQMQINRVRFQLDCSSAGTLGTPCTDDGALIEYEGDGTITTTCPGVTFSTGHGVSSNPNEVVFTPNSPILIAANTPNFCKVEFNVKVLSIVDADTTPAEIEEVAGYSAPTFDAVCNNGLQSTSSQSGSIAVCPPCTDTDCSTAACNQTTGMCEFTPKPSSTPCTDTDNDSCTTAGCDGLGVCNQSHIICVTTTTSTTSSTTSTSSTTTTSTSTSTTTSTAPCIPTPENCSNMMDDDCDNLIDCLDPDCPQPCPPAKKDPTDIRFGSGLDRLRSKAILEMVPVDLCTVGVGVLVTNPHGEVFREAVHGSQLNPCATGRIFRYRNLAARENGGLYSLKLKKRNGDTAYSFSSISYGDLSATKGTPEEDETLKKMRVQFYVGDKVFITIEGDWKRTPTGWRAPKDH
jgi:hypothetical protein